jgi:hypothetical protein
VTAHNWNVVYASIIVGLTGYGILFVRLLWKSRGDE